MTGKSFGNIEGLTLYNRVSQQPAAAPKRVEKLLKSIAEEVIESIKAGLNVQYILLTDRFNTQKCWR